MEHEVDEVALHATRGTTIVLRRGSTLLVCPPDLPCFEVARATRIIGADLNPDLPHPHRVTFVPPEQRTAWEDLHWEVQDGRLVVQSWRRRRPSNPRIGRALPVPDATVSADAPDAEARRELVALLLEPLAARGGCYPAFDEIHIEQFLREGDRTVFSVAMSDAFDGGRTDLLWIEGQEAAFGEGLGHLDRYRRVSSPREDVFLFEADIDVMPGLYRRELAAVARDGTRVVVTSVPLVEMTAYDDFECPTLPVPAPSGGSDYITNCRRSYRWQGNVLHLGRRTCSARCIVRHAGSTMRFPAPFLLEVDDPEARASFRRQSRPQRRELGPLGFVEPSADEAGESSR